MLIPPSLSSKKKWAKDPNNTAWSRNTDTFGHKIMRSQGWAPGDYLGAKDASHSEYFGAANASHIRAVLKDDNMGLGAKRNQGDECVGLDAFQELLGRLNGKSEESLDEARKKREEAKVNKYLHRKLGTVRFVFAGYLVGDKVQALADELKREEEADDEDTAESKKEKKSKKRKAEVEDGTTSEEKKSKKSKMEDADDDSKAKRREKKEKKRRERALKDDSNESNVEPEEGKTDETSEDASSRTKSKKAKKEKRNKSKDAEEVNASDSVSKEKKKKKKNKSEKNDEANSTESSVLPTPIASGAATPIPHRHLARQRFIAQKRAAVMDQAALNQVRQLNRGCCAQDSS